MAQLFAPTPPDMVPDPILPPPLPNTQTVSAVIPSSHPITMPRTLDVSDFDRCQEGNILWANVRRLRPSLREGSTTLTTPPRPLVKHGCLQALTC